jgi:hypothetical protein
MTLASLGRREDASREVMVARTAVDAAAERTGQDYSAFAAEDVAFLLEAEHARAAKPAGAAPGAR